MVSRKNQIERPAKALVTARELAEVLGVSLRVIYLRRHDPAFPRLVLLGPKCPRYALDDVPQYLAALATTSAPPEPAQLARGRAKRMPAPHPIATSDAGSQAMHAMAHVGSPNSKVVG